jgi:hypothetical protein
VCNIDGSCADPTAVLYVNNGNGCTGSAHAGTIGDPYCQIQDAITNLGSKTIIRVFGSSMAYGALTISSGTVSIVGPTTGMTAKVSGTTGNPALNISGSTTTVTLDGLEITGGAVGQDGVDCTNGSLGPAVTIYRSSLHGLGGVGVSATKCKLVMERDDVENNSGGGLSLTGVQYNITNCYIVANLSTQPGVFFGPNSVPIAGGGFRHNTVAGNGGIGSVGGISCQQGGAGALAIENSIIWNNSKTGAGASATQIAGNCSFNYVDTDEGTTPPPTSTNKNIQPDFVQPTMPKTAADYHLNGRTANNLACCVDQIPSSPVTDDYDGKTRPINVKWDEGANEVSFP